MNKLLLMLVSFAICTSVEAQKVSRIGNTFVQSSKVHKDTLVTKYTYKDNNGKVYKIIANKANGRCYIWKKSKKGKLYKQYMDSNVCMAICKESNIKYIKK